MLPLRRRVPRTALSTQVGPTLLLLIYLVLPYEASSAIPASSPTSILQPHLRSHRAVADTLWTDETPSHGMSESSEQELLDAEEVEDLEKNIETDIKEMKEERKIMQKKVDAIVMDRDSDLKDRIHTHSDHLSAGVEREDDPCSMLFSLKAAKCPTRKTKASHTAKCRPDYFIAGARKGGTTSLHVHLAAHPAIHPFRIRGRPDDGECFYELGDEQYAAQDTFYNDVPEGMMVGESTVARLVNDAAKFPDFCPETRIILLLRDPVDRCVSQFRMRQRIQRNKKHPGSVSGSVLQELRKFSNYHEFGKANLTADKVATFKQGYFPHWRSSRNAVYEGVYALHIMRLLNGGFPRSQIRIYWSEDFFRNPRAIVEDALKFLGLDTGPESGMDWSRVAKPVNAMTKKQKSTINTNFRLELNHSIETRYRGMMRPYNMALEKLVGGESPWPKVPPLYCKKFKPDLTSCHTY